MWREEGGVQDEYGVDISFDEAKRILAASRQSEERLIGLYGQLEEIEAWAAAHDYRIVGHVKENRVSGAKPLILRRDLVRAVWAVEDGEADGMAFPAQDRMARDMESVEQLRAAFSYMGKPLYSVELGRNIADETRMERWERIKADFAAMAHVYVEQEGLQKGRRDKRNRGGYVGGGDRLPRKYGYHRIQVRGKTEYAPVEEEQAVIREVRQRRSEGEAYPAIAADLNARGLRHSTGREWSKKTVRDLAVQPGRTPGIGLVGTGARVPVPAQRLRDRAERRAVGE